MTQCWVRPSAASRASPPDGRPHQPPQVSAHSQAVRIAAASWRSSIAHGLVGVVAAVGVAHEQHGHRYAGLGEGRGVVRGGTAEGPGRDAERLRGRREPVVDPGRYRADHRLGAGGRAPPSRRGARRPPPRLRETPPPASPEPRPCRRDVEAEAERARNRRQAMGRGRRVEPAEGDGHRAAGGSRSARPYRGPGRSPRRPRAASRRKRRGVPTWYSDADPDVGVADVARDPGAQTDRDLGLLQARRPARYMHLQEGMDRGGVEGGPALRSASGSPLSGDVRGEAQAAVDRAASSAPPAGCRVPLGCRCRRPGTRRSPRRGCP